MQTQPKLQPNSLPPVAHQTRVLSIPQLDCLVRSLELSCVTKQVGPTCGSTLRSKPVHALFSTTGLYGERNTCYQNLGLFVHMHTRKFIMKITAPKGRALVLQPGFSSLNQRRISPHISWKKTRQLASKASKPCMLDCLYGPRHRQPRI